MRLQRVENSKIPRFQDPKITIFHDSKIPNYEDSKNQKLEDAKIREDSKIQKMKINEKTLISFASSSAPCDREGWLLKRGEVKISISHLINSPLKNLLNSIFLKG